MLSLRRGAEAREKTEEEEEEMPRQAELDHLKQSLRRPEKSHCATIDGDDKEDHLDIGYYKQRKGKERAIAATRAPAILLDNDNGAIPPATDAQPVPHFKQTSSPELDAWLARFRDAVFIPKHISEAQRKIVFKANAAEILRQEPVSVNLGNGIDEDYRLKPLDYTQLPRTKDLKQVISLMKTDEDWSTLLPFLAGMAQSGRKIHVEDWEWITRRAGQAGYHHVLVQCAKQSKRTGYRLATRAVARRFYLNFHHDAVVAGFQGEKLERIFKSAVVCSFLFNQKEHIPRGEFSPARLPDIIGVLLELSAARSIDAFEAKDFDDGVVRRYAEKLISAWNVVPFNVPNYAPAANQKVLEWLPMWNGINLALKVDTIQADPALQKELSSRKKEIEEKIDGAITQTKKIASGMQNRFGLMAAEALSYKI